MGFFNKAGESIIKTVLRDELPIKTETGEIWRASRMAYMCPRREILHQLLDRYVDVIPANNRLKMDAGTALHDWFQNQYYGPLGILDTGDKGYWQCNNCKHKVQGKMPLKPHDCFENKDKIVFAENRYWHYIEPEFCDNRSYNDIKFQLTGHCDGVIDVNGERYLLEMKTTSPKGFAYMKSPYDAHIFQTNIYMHYFGLDKVIIQYIDRSFEDRGFEDIPLKEFVLERDNLVHHKAISKIHLYYQCKEEEILPYMIEPCATKGSSKPPAAWCPYVEECFELENKEYTFEEIMTMFDDGRSNSPDKDIINKNKDSKENTSNKSSKATKSSKKSSGEVDFNVSLW